MGLGVLNTQKLADPLQEAHNRSQESVYLDCKDSIPIFSITQMCYVQ